MDVLGAVGRWIWTVSMVCIERITGRAAYDPAMMGRIQLVVATPDVGELLWRGETGRGIVPLQPERVGVDIRLGRREHGSGSGRRSLKVHQARTLRSRRVCCRALVSGGSARVAVCRLLDRRCWGVICRSRSGREIAVLLARGSGVRAIARALGRAPSTISRELQRNAAIGRGRVEVDLDRPRHAERRAQRPKPAKLAVNAQLRAYVQDRLSGTVQRPDGSIRSKNIAWRGRRQGPRKDRRWGQCWSPEQIAGRLRVDFPG